MPSATKSIGTGAGRTGRAGGREGPTYVIEHMEEGLEDWCELEYRHMCSFVPRSRLHFLRWPREVPQVRLIAPADAAVEDPQLPGTTHEGFEAIARRLREQSAGTASASGDSATGLFANLDRTCLLDMEAEEALQPEDAALFDELVFGGILGNVIEREDGSYGSDDRTSELRKLGFANRRHLGPMQMTTDTALLVSKMVLEEARALAEIPFVDSPEIVPIDRLGEGGSADAGASDSVVMEGFRYVARRSTSGDWEPVLPEGMRELLLKSADDDILGSL